MSRFFVPPGSISGDVINISGSEAHHIVDVMRLSVGDKVAVFDGTGNEYTGVIEALKPRSVVVRVSEKRRPDMGGNIRITLIQAIPKKDRMDYIVEKATELGVGSVVPVMTERTIPQWNEKKADAHVLRWIAIAREAAKQCGRADIPEISVVKKFDRAITDLACAPIKLIAALSGCAMPVKHVLGGAHAGDTVIAIGPEGDFTQEELALAEKAGFLTVDLGPRVLRSDTAGLSVISMVNYEFSE